MYSDNSSHAPSTSLEAHTPLAPADLVSPRPEAQLLGFVRRADLWLALVAVVLASWAAFSASSWLLQGWQFH